MDIGNLNQEILNLENDIREVEEEIEALEGTISNLEDLKHSLQKQLRESKKPIIYSKYSPKFGVSNLNKQKIKNCFKWQKIKKKVRKYERNKI